MIRPILILVFLILMFGTGGATSAEEDVILIRQEGMRLASEKMTMIKFGIRASEFKQTLNYAKDLQTWSELFSNYFPAGTEASINNESAANENIWSNARLFDDLVIQIKDGIKSMIAATRSRDKRAQLGGFNMTKNACENCHKEFRN